MDSVRIVVMGYSIGGIAALLAVDKGGIERRDAVKFRAVVAYYPPCEFGRGVLTAPALILIGERDDWTPASRCRKLAAHENDIGIARSPDTGTPITLVVYPDAAHAFDYRLPPHRYLGHFIHYDEFAAQDAETQVRAFLRRVLESDTEH